jgi:hypothetical protein
MHGLRHPQSTVLTITLACLFCGGQGGHRAAAAFARDLSPTQRATGGGNGLDRDQSKPTIQLDLGARSSRSPFSASRRKL